MVKSQLADVRICGCCNKVRARVRDRVKIRLKIGVKHRAKISNKVVLGNHLADDIVDAHTCKAFRSCLANIQFCL